MNNKHLHIHLHGSNTPEHLHLHFHGEYEAKPKGVYHKHGEEFRDFDEIYTPIPYPTFTKTRPTADPHVGEICAQGRHTMSGSPPDAVYAWVFHDAAAVPTGANPTIPTGAVQARVQSDGKWYFDSTSDDYIPGVWRDPLFYRDKNWVVFYFVFGSITKHRSRRVRSKPNQVTECDPGIGPSGSGSGELATLAEAIDFAVPKTVQLSCQTPKQAVEAEKSLHMKSPTVLNYDTLSSNIGVPQWQASDNGCHWRLRVSNVGDNKRGKLYYHNGDSKQALAWTADNWCFKKQNVLIADQESAGAPQQLIVESI